MNENQLRRTSQVQPLHKFAANKARGRLQAFHGRRRRGFVSLNHHQHARGPRVGSKKDLAHIGQTNAWVAEFPLENRFDFLAKSLAEPLPVILLAPPFQRITPK